MDKRQVEIKRKTKETDICMKLSLDDGAKNIETGIGFFDHMLNSFAMHGGFGLSVTCKGDLHVDGHHTIEDVGIVLGQAFAQALGNKQGIERFASAYVPMDEALAFAVCDVSGRPYLRYEATFAEEKVGEFDTCMVEEFFRAFATHAGITLHIQCLYGTNGHHSIEALFKAAARALKQSVQITGTGILSTKGVL